ncbi:L-lactate dehydrogenase complex protein LldF [Desulfocicer vacuolatum DSM 3385]|uniref:L-lactate dehydrogenase complex protein LldF n=1 Tax=Desulfocicer vacuolatum DSM 3385 TaxID=1121400 RepID=A0A1W2EPV2_9BACT|nr:LutB/LldF family L-lactate oxidation iron-sulfur protein [Desulfocicer vacuolatum]SMD11757.1 L-lactate dehydrogenase complex protein LldF [Desulfocicer vacuolatum DSM 3385]
MEVRTQEFATGASDALADQQLRTNLRKFMTILKTLRKQVSSEVVNLDELQQRAKDVKNHALENLDYYLELFETKLSENGGRVHYAQTPEDLNQIVIEICRRVNARHVVKGKTMVGEETALNEALIKAGLDVVETDMGEYIVQLANEPPSHILGPAVHKNKKQIADLFYSHHDLGNRSLAEVPEIVGEARHVIREKFLQADVGITGANALIAETGSSLLLTNEGNGDLCSTLPKVHIVVTGIEKLVASLEDASAMLRVIARGVVGQSMACYTSIFTGPREGAQDAGPEEFHVVLLDNTRSELLGNELRDILRCVKCSACLNHCPIYGQIGGHAYGWVYSGPMGSVLTPQLVGMEKATDLFNACTSDGRCAEVCPMVIPLPDLLRKLRVRQWNQNRLKRTWRWGLLMFMLTARYPRIFKRLSKLGVRVLNLLGGGRGALNSLPIKSGWTDVRDLPMPQGETFQSLWARQLKQKKGER